jgi:uncharacterized RDD family membrane protein YckC
MLAPRNTRLVGQAVDVVVAAVPMIALVTIDPAGIGGEVPGVAMLAVALSGTYYFLCDALLGGQSLGKRWLDMAVVDAETGEPCTLWQSFVRNLLLALLGPIDWLFIFGERRQRLGDKAAGTIVVDV